MTSNLMIKSQTLALFQECFLVIEPVRQGILKRHQSADRQEV